MDLGGMQTWRLSCMYVSMCHVMCVCMSHTHVCACHTHMCVFVRHVCTCARVTPYICVTHTHVNNVCGPHTHSMGASLGRLWRDEPSLGATHLKLLRGVYVCMCVCVCVASVWGLEQCRVCTPACIRIYKCLCTCVCWCVYVYACMCGCKEVEHAVYARGRV